MASHRFQQLYIQTCMDGWVCKSKSLCHQLNVCCGLHGIRIKGSKNMYKDDKKHDKINNWKCQQWKQSEKGADFKSQWIYQGNVEPNNGICVWINSICIKTQLIFEFNLSGCSFRLSRIQVNCALFYGCIVVRCVCMWSCCEWQFRAVLTESAIAMNRKHAC